MQTATRAHQRAARSGVTDELIVSTERIWRFAGSLISHAALLPPPTRRGSSGAAPRLSLSSAYTTSQTGAFRCGRSRQPSGPAAGLSSPSITHSSRAALTSAVATSTPSWCPIPGRKADVEVTQDFWRRPLATVLGAFADAGFKVDRVAEPQPSAEALRLFPDDLGPVVGVPLFIVYRLWLQP
jgi:hypothetical protein